MANPQKENGHVKIATELFIALISIRISGEARQCLDFIIRKTYGFNKTADKIALSQFVNATKMTKIAVCKALSKLEQMQLIIITKKGKGVNIGNTYVFNKNYDDWKPLPKKVKNKGKVLEGRLSLDDIKTKIRQRDNNICLICGYNGNKTEEILPVHHIDFNQNNNENDNLITVCKSCHAKGHTNNEDIKNHYRNIVTQKGNSVLLPKNTIKITKKHNKPLPKKQNTKDNITKDNITKDIIAAKPPNEVNDLIDFFRQTVNPHLGFNNKTERKAAEDLIKAYGLEKTKEAVLFLQDRIKTDKYLPIITSPYELWIKWAKIKQHLIKGVQEKKGIRI